MNVHSLILECTNFELEHDKHIARNISWAIGEITVDHCRITAYKNLDSLPDQLGIKL